MKTSPWNNFYGKLCACKGKRNALVHPDGYANISETDIEFLDQLYQNILNQRDPLCKLSSLHKAKFYVDGKLVETVPFKAGDSRSKEPAVPIIPGYDVKWENYTLGDKDIVSKQWLSKRKKQVFS